MLSTSITIRFHRNNSDHAFYAYDFNQDTKILEIKNFISKKFRIKLFRFEIKEPDGEFVHVDCEYIRNINQNQVQHSNIELTSAQIQIIDLYIKETSHNQQKSTVHPNLCPSSSSSIEHPLDEQNKDSRRILLNKNPCISFTHQINPKLKGEYASNSQNTRKGEAIARPISMQGYKLHLPDAKKRTRVLPKISVQREKIPQGMVPKLHCYLLCEDCKNGQRIFYKHHIYGFYVDEKNKNSKTTDCFILPWNEDFFSREGHEIDLKLITIVSAKTHLHISNEEFCRLDNKYSKTTNYKTNRLAILIEINGVFLWDHLLLSNAFEFCHAQNEIKHDSYEIRDVNGNLIEYIPEIIEKTIAKSSPPKKKYRRSNTDDINIEPYSNTYEMAQVNGQDDFNPTNIATRDTLKSSSSHYSYNINGNSIESSFLSDNDIDFNSLGAVNINEMISIYLPNNTLP